MYKKRIVRKCTLVVFTLITLTFSSQVLAEPGDINWQNNNLVFQFGDIIWTNWGDGVLLTGIDANGFVFPHCFPKEGRPVDSCTLVQAVVIGSYSGEVAITERLKHYLALGRHWVPMEEITFVRSQLTSIQLEELDKPLYLVAIQSDHTYPIYRWILNTIPEQRVLLSGSQ